VKVRVSYMRGVLVGETKLATPCLCGLLEVVVAGGVIVGRAQGLAVKRRERRRWKRRRLS